MNVNVDIVGVIRVSPGFHIYWLMFAFVVLNESLAQKLFIAKKNFEKS